MMLHWSSRPGSGPPVAGSVKSGVMAATSRAHSLSRPVRSYRTRQALQAADRRVPEPAGAGEVQGVQQVGFLGPQHREDLGRVALIQPG